MLLQVAFIVLKLCNYIAWPWIWVLAPLWIGTILAVLWFGLHILLIWRMSK